MAVGFGVQSAVQGAQVLAAVVGGSAWGDAWKGSGGRRMRGLFRGLQMELTEITAQAYRVLTECLALL